MNAKASKVTFGAAMQELESILRRVEGEEIDIDELADELKRATELLEVCRAKIRRAEVEVSQIVQTLEAPEAEVPEPDFEPRDAREDQAAVAKGTTASLFEHDG